MIFSCSGDFSLASFNAERLPTPLPIATDVKMLSKLPFIGGMIFCGLLILVFESVFCKATVCCLQPAQPRLKIRSAFHWRGD